MWKSYSTQFNLNKHCRAQHNIQKQGYSCDDNVYNFKCLDCSFPRSFDLIEHLRNEYGQKKLEFQTMEGILFFNT